MSCPHPYVSRAHAIDTRQGRWEPRPVRAGPGWARRETSRGRCDGVDGCAGRQAGRGAPGQGGHSKARVHHVADPGVHDHRLRRQPAERADDGRLRPDVRVPLPRAGDHLPGAAGAGRRGACIRMDRRGLPLGERGPVRQVGPAGGVVPVRDDDLLLPDPARVRREHAGLRLQPGSRHERHLHRHRHRRRLLDRRVPLGARRYGRDRQARLERPARRHADPGCAARHPGRRLPAPGQLVGRAHERRPPDPAVDGDREPGPDRQQLPLVLGDGDERRPRRVAAQPQERVPARDVLRDAGSCC